MTKPIRRPKADVTRQAIIESARKLFVKKGFAATSISEIASGADINQSLIYHHFGNKEELWKAIKQEAITSFQEKQHTNFDELLTIDDFNQFITDLVSYRFEIYDRYPDLRRMIDWQFMESAPQSLRTIPGDVLVRFRDKIVAYQKSGAIKKQHNPELIVTFLMNSPLGFFRSYRDFTKGLTKKQNEQLKKEYCDLVTKILLEGLS